MKPLAIFVLLILGLPTLELYLLIEIGSEIGAVPAIFLVLFTAVLGGFLMQRQGIRTLMRVRRSMDQGEVPALDMLEGAVLLLGGLLLLIPGFFTDAVGFLCLVPGLRRLLLRKFLRRAQLDGEVLQSADRPGADRPAPGPRVIEGEFRREND